MLHAGVTEHPAAAWIIQQLREAFPYDAVPRYLVFDNDKKYGTDVLAVIERMGIRRKQITPYSPWQNGAAEGWVEPVRLDLLDHVIVPRRAAHEEGKHSYEFTYRLPGHERE